MAFALPAAALAQDTDSPLRNGAYVAPMASYVWSDDKHMDDGFGGSLALGYRQAWYALELSGLYQAISAGDGNTAKLTGAGVNALLFPAPRLSGLYLLVGAGGMQIKSYPTGGDSTQFSNTFVNAGPGYLFPLKAGRYDFAVRTEVLYRYGHRDSSPLDTTMAPDNFNYVLVNVGFQLPLNRAAAPPPPPASEPIAVVPPAPPPDSDGDGVPDDRDQCPGTAQGAQVDDVGCPLPPPCEAPAPGQKADLAGCAAGDSILLRGVNFEFDKATLTLNAKTLLDGIGDALIAAPAIKVEIAGYTDARGSDGYNQKLSQQRAESVVQYLTDRGVDAGRMTARGYGETQPVADNDTDEGRELNRRVELKVTEGAATATTAPPLAALPAADAAATEAPPPPEVPADAPAPEVPADKPPVP
ncbi:OmpA family protein [Solimonas soli]|uniref:OmpA family protein n=1 Tax=Solimonas soli TaxID=413479 RepID=UPI0012FC4239|nr:OmpA family protein [Solimonas soli]